MTLITMGGNCMGNTKGGTRRCGHGNFCICWHSLRSYCTIRRHCVQPASCCACLRLEAAVLAKIILLGGETAHLVCRARTRTSGFRTRRLTPGGRHVLRNRRKKGRKVLAPANNYKK